MHEFVAPPDSELLFDEASGIYIPQRFAKEIYRGDVSGVANYEYDILEQGPEHEDYWNVWTDVLDNARLHGYKSEYYLHQDGCVWAVPVDAPVYDDENMEELAERVAAIMTREELEDEYVQSLTCEYRCNPEIFFEHARSVDLNTEDPDGEYADLPDRTRLALDEWAEYGQLPGGFVTAVLENDLMGAMSRADLSNAAAIDAITKYVYNHLPAACWGSPEKVREWRQSKR